MQLNFDNFIIGLRSVLSAKTAEEAIVHGHFNSSIFPTLDTQHSWKFARNDKKLHLHDGNVVHTFTSEHFKDDEDFPVTKAEDGSYFEFGKDMPHTGTAQVHRANPGMIYVTLHDGDKNPTYTISHVSENSWRASPKVHSKEGEEAVSFEEFAKGLNSKIAEFDLFKSLSSAGDSVLNGIQALGEKPWASAGLGLALGGTYDLAKRHLYNTEEENQEETFGDRAFRWLTPAAVLGGIGGIQSSLMPGHYEGGHLNHSGPEARRWNIVPKDYNSLLPTPSVTPLPGLAPPVPHVLPSLNY
jgi:hypothetical protein